MLLFLINLYFWDPINRCLLHITKPNIPIYHPKTAVWASTITQDRRHNGVIIINVMWSQLKWERGGWGQGVVTNNSIHLYGKCIFFIETNHDIFGVKKNSNKTQHWQLQVDMHAENLSRLSYMLYFLFQQKSFLVKVGRHSLASLWGTRQIPWIGQYFHVGDG